MLTYILKIQVNNIFIKRTKFKYILNSAQIFTHKIIFFIYKIFNLYF